MNSYRIQIKSNLKYIALAAEKENLHAMPIIDIKRKHIKRILDACADVNPNFTDKCFNEYRKNMRKLFSDLMEIDQDSVDTNPVKDIKKQKVIRKIKKILTPKECTQVDAFAKKYDKRFWLLIHIFFHSGCRTTEIFRVKARHIDLKKQSALFTILKGNQPFEVLKPIKNIAVPLWKEALSGAQPEDYVFGKSLMPSKTQIHSRHATRRWKRHIKNKLGIDCDWYSLRHLHTTQVVEQLNVKEAMKLTSHKSTEMIDKIYDVRKQQRDDEHILTLNNKFA